MVASLAIVSACGTKKKPFDLLSGNIERRQLVIPDNGESPGPELRRSYWPLMLHDGARNIFRMWHMRDHGDGTSDVVYRESIDAFKWEGDGQIVFNVRGFVTGFASNDGILYFSYYDVNKTGAQIATSSDGLNWKSGDTVIAQKSVLDGPQDILQPFFLRDGRMAIYAKAFDGGPINSVTNAPGLGLRITNTWLPSSNNYEIANTALKATEGEGALEFYGLTPFYLGGKLYSAVRTLRDDIANGVGESVIASSEDGITWNRTHNVLLARGNPGDFDAAMAWVTSVVTVGQKTYLAYSGYDLGHKIGTRQIGMAVLVH